MILFYKNYLSKDFISNIISEINSPKIGMNSNFESKKVNIETRIVAPITQPKPDANPLIKLKKSIFHIDS